MAFRGREDLNPSLSRSFQGAQQNWFQYTDLRSGSFYPEHIGSSPALTHCSDLHHLLDRFLLHLVVSEKHSPLLQLQSRKSVCAVILTGTALVPVPMPRLEGPKALLIPRAGLPVEEQQKVAASPRKVNVRSAGVLCSQTRCKLNERPVEANLLGAFSWHWSWDGGKQVGSTLPRAPVRSARGCSVLGLRSGGAAMPTKTCWQAQEA